MWSTVPTAGASVHDITIGSIDNPALGTNPNLVTLTQAERWDGKLPVTMVPGGALPMLTVK